MEESINQRLKKYIDYKKIVWPVLFKGTRITRQSWNSFTKTGKSIPSEKLGIVISKMPDLNTRWLLTGEGSMIETNYQQHDNRYSANDSPQPPPITQRRCSDPGCNAELVKLNDEIVRYKLIIDQLINRADMLRRDDPPEKYVTGGVAKSGQKSQNKKAG